jgi:hypothetical protein
MSERISDDDILRVLELVADGEYLKEACAMAGISYSTVFRRLNSSEEWRAKYDTAMLAWGEARASMIGKEIRSMEDAKMANVISRHEQWAIEALCRARFGRLQRVEVDANVSHRNYDNTHTSVLLKMLGSKLKELGVSSIDELVELQTAPLRQPVLIENESGKLTVSS